MAGEYDTVKYELDVANHKYKAIILGKHYEGDLTIEPDELPNAEEIAKQLRAHIFKPNEDKSIYDIWYYEKGFGMVHVTEYGDFDHYMKRAMGCLSLEGTKYRPIDIEVEQYKLEKQKQKGRWYDWDIERTNGRDVVVLLDNDLSFLDNMDLDDLQIE